MRRTLSKPRALFKSLLFEHLEDRAMMAGNVCCACTNGNLCITGDKCDNQICVRQCSDGKIEIRGLCGTTINGCECVTVCNVCAIKCDLKDGCDSVKIQDCCVRECICVCGGNGNDCIQVCGCEAAGIGINGANGADDVRISCCTITCSSKCDGKKDRNGCTQGQVCCDTGNGCDNVLIERVCGCCIVQCKTGGDKDCIVVTRCDVKKIYCDSGSGCDTVAINRCRTSDICQVKCSDKKSNVCFESNTCKTQKCNIPCRANRRLHLRIG